MRDLIVFGEDWGGLPSSTQHLVGRLAQDRQVVWVNSIGLRQPALTWRDSMRAVQKILGKAKTGYNHSAKQTELNSIKVVNLRTIPAPKSAIARRIARDVMLHQLHPILEKMSLSSPILWSSLPTAADLCGHLNESAVVYYCGDDFSALAGVDHRVVTMHERCLAEKANLIFAASENIKAKFPACKTQLLPHGVDTQLFSTPSPRASDLPNNGKPIAGFYGSLSQWLDYDLIHHIACNLPNWEFVFIGPIELSSCQLPKLPNVHYLGPKAHYLLPSYSQHWNVSLLPFKANQQIQACSPLKLMEYLAAGSAIVTTDFPALKPYRKHVNIAQNSEEMISMLHLACQQPKLPRDIVTQESWDSRSQFVNWMLELL